MQKKEQKERQKKQNKQVQEDHYCKKKELEKKISKHEKEKELLNEEKKDNEEMAIAQSVITKGNKRLATVVSNKDINETATASALISSTQKQFSYIQKSITSVEEHHAKSFRETEEI